MNCIFCRIIAQEIPASKFYEDEKAIAFLDIHPVKMGHSLVIPKNHASYLFEMTEKDYQDLILSAKKVAEILKQAFNPKSGKIGVIVYGLDVDHTHIHLIPIDKAGDLNLGKSHPASDEELKQSLSKIKKFLIAAENTILH